MSVVREEKLTPTLLWETATRDGGGGNDGFVLNGIVPCHPWVSWLWLSMGGFVHTSPVHVHLCPGCVYGSDSFRFSGDVLAEHEDISKRQGGVQCISLFCVP